MYKYRSAAARALMLAVAVLLGILTFAEPSQAQFSSLSGNITTGSGNLGGLSGTINDVNFGITSVNGGAGTFTLTLDSDLGGTVNGPITWNFTPTLAMGAQLTGVTTGGFVDCFDCTNNPFAQGNAGLSVNTMAGTFSYTSAGNFSFNDEFDFTSLNFTVTSVIPATPMADASAGEPYNFSAANAGAGILLNGSLSRKANGIDAIDPGNFDWVLNPGGTNTLLAGANAHNSNPTVSLSALAAAGLTSTVDNLLNPSVVNVQLTVDQDGMNVDTDTDTTTIQWQNSGPNISNLSVASSTFTALSTPQAVSTTITDADGALNGTNGLPANFDNFDFSYTLAASALASGNDVNSVATIGSGLTVSLAQALAAGLLPGNPINLNLSVNDKAGASDSESVMLTYQNSQPGGSLSVAPDAMGDGIDLTVNINDPDLNVPVGDFVNGELFAVDGMGNMTSLGMQGTSANGSFLFDIDQSTLDALVDAGAVGFKLQLTDNFGGTGMANVSFNQAVPEPATLAIWSMLGLAFGWFVIRRRRAK